MRWRPSRRAGVLLLSALALVPAPAAAHDDPVVTVRVMCDGFTVLDPSQVRGEIADNATLSVDRSVRGSQQIDAWIDDEMAHDLRIQVLDIRPPEQLQDGYTVTWTGRWSRDDWPRAGQSARETTEKVVIHNGRITRWTSSLAAAQSISGGAVSGAASTTGLGEGVTPIDTGSDGPIMPPPSLVAAAGVALVGLGLAVRGLVRRRRGGCDRG